MGCITSSQRDINTPHSGEVKALSADMKTRFANVDPDVLGDYKEDATAELIFVYGQQAGIYIIKTPPFTLVPLAEQEEKPAQDEGEGANGDQQEEPVKEVRWSIFNDSKDDAKLETTFFHAQQLRSAGSEDSVKLERKDNGMAVVSVDVPAGATVAFVEGRMKGYMYKCVVYDPKTKAFEVAASVK